MQTSAEGIAVLKAKLQSGVTPEVTERLQQLTQCLTAYNFQGALAVHKDLSDTAWKDHKDWLKPLKHLLTLSGRKFASR